jgi:hypothetical protein
VSLPIKSTEELARELPVISIIKLRIEIERAVRGYVAKRGTASKGQSGIDLVLRDLQQRDIAPASTDKLLEALGVMNRVAHGFDVEHEMTEWAIAIGTEFLAELAGSDGKGS